MSKYTRFHCFRHPISSIYTQFSASDMLSRVCSKYSIPPSQLVNLEFAIYINVLLDSTASGTQSRVYILNLVCQTCKVEFAQKYSILPSQLVNLEFAIYINVFTRFHCFRHPISSIYTQFSVSGMQT